MVYYSPGSLEDPQSQPIAGSRVRLKIKAAENAAPTKVNRTAGGPVASLCSQVLRMRHPCKGQYTRLPRFATRRASLTATKEKEEEEEEERKKKEEISC